jgi:hypothetical protein
MMQLLLEFVEGKKANSATTDNNEIRKVDVDGNEKGFGFEYKTVLRDDLGLLLPLICKHDRCRGCLCNTLIGCV